MSEVLGGNMLELGPCTVSGGCLGALEKPVLDVYAFVLENKCGTLSVVMGTPKGNARGCTQGRWIRHPTVHTISHQLSSFRYPGTVTLRQQLNRQQTTYSIYFLFMFYTCRMETTYNICIHILYVCMHVLYIRMYQNCNIE